MFFSVAAGVMNTTSVFRWLSATGEEKMDPDKSVVFAYDAVPAHLDLFPPHTYTAYASPLDIVEKDLSCLKATPKANISRPEI